MSESFCPVLSDVEDLLEMDYKIEALLNFIVKKGSINDMVVNK